MYVKLILSFVSRMWFVFAAVLYSPFREVAVPERGATGEQPQEPRRPLPGVWGYDMDWEIPGVSQVRMEKVRIQKITIFSLLRIITNFCTLLQRFSIFRNRGYYINSSTKLFPFFKIRAKFFTHDFFPNEV